MKPFYLSFIYFMIFNSFAKANEMAASEHFDFVKASQAAMAAQKFTGLVGSRPTSDQCVPIKNSQGDSVMSCSVPDSEIDNNVIVKIPEYPEGKIPEAIKQILPENFVKDVAQKKVSCVFNFRLANDNQQMLGCKGPTKYNQPGLKTVGDKCGDDWGFTHGLQVGVSCTSADGLSQTFTYSTDLFTDPNLASRKVDLRGVTQMDQKFISENIFSYLQDNVNQGNVSYWRRGVGFVNVSSKKKWGFLQSTGQQEWFHDMRNRTNPGEAADYNYIDGEKDKWGAFVTLATGLQTKKDVGSYCQVSASVEVGARLATLKDSNLIYGSVNGKFGVMVGEGQIYARAAYEQTRRLSSNVGEATLAFGYERKSGAKIEVGLKKQNGNRRDVPDSSNLVAQTNRGVHKNDVILFLGASY